MSMTAFPPHIAAALDRLSVPPLPAGFADRLIARIETAEDVPPLPRPRPIGGGGWRRSGRIVAIAATLGLATATAAASGIFGDPVYVPLVSDALASAELVELPRPSAVESKAAMAPPPPEKAAPLRAKPANREAVRKLFERLRADPEYRALPRRERQAIVRQEMRKLLQSGELSASELRRAMAERRSQGDPAKREAIRRRLQQRAPQAAMPGRAERPRAEAWREAFDQLPPERQERIIELREQLRAAPPGERRAILREMLAERRSASAAPPDEAELSVRPE